MNFFLFFLNPQPLVQLWSPTTRIFIYLFSDAQQKKTAQLIDKNSDYKN